MTGLNHQSGELRRHHFKMAGPLTKNNSMFGAKRAGSALQAKETRSSIHNSKSCATRHQIDF